MLISISICFCWLTLGYACMCTQTHLRDYCKKDIVFRGTAVAQRLSEDHALHESVRDQHAHRIYSLRIDRLIWVNSEFKGIKSVNLTTPARDNLCGVHFSLNASYVIAAQFSDGSFTTRLCDGNGLWDALGKKEKRFFSTRMPKRCLQRKRKNRN